MKTDEGKITSLKDVLEQLAKPLSCRFFLDRQEVVLPVHRAMGDVLERRRELMRAVQPPFVKERNDYDTLNPQYLARRDAAQLQARSLVVYVCCPEVAALKPGLIAPEQIYAALKPLLPEPVQELIELTALAGGVEMEVDKRANFTLAAPSES